ncbi:hypothetical protein [Sphingomonas immobilis]|uniref:Uncharacterized protein n=1 Tax=Sphingomonas immobilis TaxID=3063997 RepID=A0ABT9A6S0_9SPHN|nr:hypothetical protein [Sphingomonas sp. CA1-15]MDO7844671.1 hypothetical protein [Sphingomonas sp. CA1-15]
MSDRNDTRATQRYFLIVLARIAAVAGAILGVVLIARAATLAPKILGIAIVLSALYMMAVVPAALAHRWRTPPEQ